MLAAPAGARSVDVSAPLMHGTGRHTSTGLQQIIDAVRARRLTLEPLR